MSAETNKAVSRRFLEEVFSQGKLNVADELIAHNHANSGPGALPGLPGGVDGSRMLVTSYRNAFPDINFKVDEQIAEGDTVVTRWTGHATHKGELMGIAPTGKPVTVSGVIVDRFANGKIAETWSAFDQLGMLQQLGVMPK